MITRQGRTHHLAAVSHPSDATWGDGPLYQVRLTTPYPPSATVAPDIPLGPVIGHVGRRAPRTTRWPACDQPWHVTFCTDPARLDRARWWSGFDSTLAAETFLLGHWLALHPDDPFHPDSTTPQPAGPARTPRARYHRSNPAVDDKPNPAPLEIR